MLANILALAVALGSLAIYLTAFFFPEIHRKSDFIWSGVGLFYALVLWVCSPRITGGVLLGQTASVALLGWFGWQTLTLRYSATPATQRTAVPSKEQLQEQLTSSSLPGKLKEQAGSLFANAQGQIQKTLSRFTKGKSKPEAATSQNQKPTATAATTQTTVDVAAVEAAPTATNVAREIQVPPPPLDTDPAELVKPNSPDPGLVDAAVQDAETKHLPSNPPEIVEAETSNSATASDDQIKSPPEAT